MPPSWHFDWGTFWLLAAITLAEGFRRVPAGSFLLRRVPGYPWQVAAGPYRSSAWRLVSAFSPLALHCVIQPAQGEARDPARLRGWWIALVRIPSFLALAALLVGLPLLPASMGTRGLILAIAAAFGASLLTAVVSMVALVRMGIGWKRAAGDALRGVSPFTAPRAPEIVLERVLSNVPAAEAIRALVPSDDFALWVRPFAYDQVMRGADALLARGEAERIVRAPAGDASQGDPYCPRCAGTYLPGIETCHACRVPLEHAARIEEPRVPGAAAG